MRDQPQPIGDPYRVLGLEAGASMAEVKRAYRRLAKAYHPDSAGEAALPRFLAIHEAYERLVTGRSRGVAPRAARGAQSPTAEPWRADPERARAARERARTGRGWGSATGSTGGRGSAGEARAGTREPGGPGSRTGTSGSAGRTGGTGSRGSSSSGAAGGGREGRRRPVRKATLGSTSYDEARDATDATWSGASWYGPSSGEYWIVNPREYADPRKHGPGYQQRARRAAAPGSVGTAGDDDQATVEPELDEMPPARGATPDPDRPRAARPSARASTARASTARAAASPGSAAGTAAAAGAPRTTAKGPAHAPSAGTWTVRDASLPGDRAPRGPIDSLGDAGRELLAAPGDDPIRRLGIALVAWPPIGLAAAATIGDVTGCATYAATCGGSDSLLPWLAQAVILGLLLLVPPLARVFVGGTIAVLLALVPATALLLVVGGGGQPQSSFALAVLLAVAWAAGVIWAARSAARPGGGPVT